MKYRIFEKLQWRKDHQIPWRASLINFQRRINQLTRKRDSYNFKFLQPQNSFFLAFTRNEEELTNSFTNQVIRKHVVFHPFYISFSATLSRTSFDTVRNDLDLQVCDKSGPGSSYSRHRRECSKRRGVEPRGGRGKEGRRLERNSSHRFHASPRFMKRDNRNTG